MQKQKNLAAKNDFRTAYTGRHGKLLWRIEHKLILHERKKNVNINFNIVQNVFTIKGRKDTEILL